MEDYDEYLTNHIANVNKCYELLWGTKLEGSHDESKYSEEEYEPYKTHWTGEGESTEEDYQRAWIHHVHNNPHHWNYWVVMEDDGTYTVAEMPERFFKEMIADWCSFCIKANDSENLLNWYKKHKKGIILAPKTQERTDKAIAYATKVMRRELGQGASPKH